MASSQRKKALDQLAIQVDTATVATVVLANAKLDMVERVASEMPLVEIVPGDEVPEYEKSSRGHALWGFTARLTCYFLDDIGEDEQRETLVKEIKDAIGNDSTLDGNCADCDIIAIRQEGEFPLWELVFELEISYEKGIANA